MLAREEFLWPCALTLLDSCILLHCTLFLLYCKYIALIIFSCDGKVLPIRLFILLCYLYTLGDRRSLMQDTMMPLEEEIVDIADFFKVFGDPTRLKILFLLEKGERGVNSISEELGMQQSTISQQLKLLRARRLVRFRKDGRNVLYRLNDEHIHDILALGIEHYSELL